MQASTGGIEDPCLTFVQDGHCSARVWPAAQILLQYCTEALPKGASLLELGAGTGWFGLQLCQARADITACLTEMSAHGAFERLGTNLAANARARGLRQQPTCRTLDWADADLPHGSWDYVVGSDLVYSDAGAELLCAMLARLLAAGTAVRCLYAHTAERWGAFGYDAKLFQELRRNRLLSWPVAGEIVEDLDAVIAQRCAIFEIRLLRGNEECDDAAAESVLLRASRAQALLDARRREAMSEEELEEADVAQSISELWS